MKIRVSSVLAPLVISFCTFFYLSANSQATIQSVAADEYDLIDYDIPAFLPEDAVLYCSMDADCSLIAEAIVWEARGESYEGQHAVASVILNRVDHQNFPDTINGVIYQRRQFSYIGDKHKQETPTNSDWSLAYEIAYMSLFGLARNTDALFYLNPNKVKVIPKWAREFQLVATIGRHEFYKYP